jgi:TolA-binding protein
MNTVEKLIDEQLKTSATIKTMLEGCMVLVETDTVLGERMDQLSARIDMVNKRLRKLEETNGKLQTQMSMIEDAIVNDPRLQDE